MPLVRFPEEVHALQDLVAELGVADSGIRVKSRGNGVLLQHGADPEVLADLAQKVDRTERCRPVKVIDKRYSVHALGAQKSRDLTLETGNPLPHGVSSVERALRGWPRVTDESG